MSATGGNAADYLVRVERDMTTGFLHPLVLLHVQRDGPIHGYALIKAMEATTGRSLWKEGTVYPLLAHLEKEGLVESRWGTGTSGPRRKYHQITPAGRQVVRLAAVIWKDLRTNLDRLLEEA